MIRPLPCDGNENRIEICCFRNLRASCFPCTVFAHIHTHTHTDTMRDCSRVHCRFSEPNITLAIMLETSPRRRREVRGDATEVADITKQGKEKNTEKKYEKCVKVAALWSKRYLQSSVPVQGVFFFVCAQFARLARC